MTTTQVAIEQIGYKAIAFLANLTREDIEAMPPARREQLAQLCEHSAKLVAESLRNTTRAGVLLDLVAARGTD